MCSTLSFFHNLFIGLLGEYIYICIINFKNMRIIQTFWTAGQDPLKESFGWAHSEYHLMSWALSCLNLREHYDEVELYIQILLVTIFSLKCLVCHIQHHTLSLMISSVCPSIGLCLKSKPTPYKQNHSFM